MRGIISLPILLVIATALCSVNAAPRRIKTGKETWSYVTVRDGAYMFFWLYYTTADVDYKTRPLVLWLQGGPGASSTGIGNFLEIGPQDEAMQNRTNAWTEQVNVLFVDNPVGTGFSYVNNTALLARNNSAIADDLVSFMKGFLKKVPEFETVPLYIFAESYGGKMAVQFAQSLKKAVEAKKITCQLAGVALGDSWISPVDAVNSWGPFLYATSLVDSIGLSAIAAKSKAVSDAVKAGKMENATMLWSETEELVEKLTNGVNFYNILNPPEDSSSSSHEVSQLQTSTAEEHPNHILGAFGPFPTTPEPIPTPHHKFSSPHIEHLYERHVGSVSANLDKLMNGPVKDKLKIIPKNVTWGGQSASVFDALSADFMATAVPNVESLLNNTAVKIVVYNGQLDLIVDTPGVEKWVENLKWAGTPQWLESPRKPIEAPDGRTAAFTKSYKNFSFYWIMDAGHMVPADSSEIALKMMKEIVGVK
ncbi:retinoid-inducible serine carboxypeptidase-like [Macrobrachium nipponense]|uniref:retinoid-inducible serine carboxypeptidase-like n=1 Tax=Macrobrachium nipponense TaxID=159736 RepID=UPI0030C7B026